MRRFLNRRVIVVLCLVAAMTLVIIAGCGESDSTDSEWCREDEPGNYFCWMTGRYYLLHVPESYTGETPVPLVVDMHGHHSSAYGERSVSPWTPLADVLNYIIVHPNGYNGAWNAQGVCCAFTQSPHVQDDIGFIEAVVAKIRAEYNIDPDRIIATGISNGGSMTHTLACESAHIFTAAVPMDYPLSGPGGVEGIVSSCMPARPIPIIHFHGLLDDDVVYEGNGDRLAARDSNYAWSVIQNCSSELVTTHISDNMFCETYENCDGGVAVSMCTVTDSGHVVTLMVDDPDIATLSWDFLEQFFE